MKRKKEDNFAHSTFLFSDEYTKEQHQHKCKLSAQCLKYDPTVSNWLKECSLQSAAKIRDSRKEQIANLQASLPDITTASLGPVVLIFPILNLKIRILIAKYLLQNPPVYFSISKMVAFVFRLY